jgi:hypothetical protein
MDLYSYGKKNCSLKWTFWESPNLVKNQTIHITKFNNYTSYHASRTIKING